VEGTLGIVPWYQQRGTAAPAAHLHVQEIQRLTVPITAWLHFLSLELCYLTAGAVAIHKSQTGQLVCKTLAEGRAGAGSVAQAAAITAGERILSHFILD
jgi:hypothetical protein